jgi:ribonuclease P protein component
MREADLPAEQPEAQEEARVSRPDADARRTGGAAVPARSRPCPPVGLIWRVRGRETFRELARAPARRRGPLSLRFVPDERAVPPRVAYALGRSVGSAPVRNRLRRRLRAAIHERAALLAPGSYLVGAGPGAVTMSPDELRGAVAELLRGVRAGGVPGAGDGASR